MDSYSGSRVLPRKVVERNLTLIVGGAGPPLAAFTSAKVFEVNAGFPALSPPSPSLFSRRSIAAPPRQRCNRPPLYRSWKRGEIYRVHATRAFHQHMSCYLRARHYSLPDLLYFMLRGWTRNSFESFQRLQSGHVDRAGTRSAYDVSSRHASIMSTSSSTFSNPIPLVHYILFNLCACTCIYIYVFYSIQVFLIRLFFFDLRAFLKVSRYFFGRVGRELLWNF